MTETGKTAIVPASRKRERILTAVRKHVIKSFINVAHVDLKAWEAELERQKGRLVVVEQSEFENGIRELLNQLKSSHTAFYHGQQNRFLSQHTIGATLKAVDHCNTRRWMFLDIYPEGSAHTASIKPGDLLIELNGVQTSPANPPSFETGRSHQLRIQPVDGGPLRDLELTVPFRKASKNRPPIVEPKAITAEFIAPGIGVLKIPYFSGSFGLEFGEELRRAIEDLKTKGASRLIVDLRGNIGGGLGFAILASYLCADQRPIGYSITPKTLRDGVDKSELMHVPTPRTRAQLALTLGRFLLRDKSVVLLTQGLGAQPFHGKTVVLVNEWTNSAGEMLAAFASDNALARVVGTKTAGNVLGAANFEVGSGYWVRLPVFGWFTWFGGSLEGCGVTPDRKVEYVPFGMGNTSSEYVEIADSAAEMLPHVTKLRGNSGRD